MSEPTDLLLGLRASTADLVEDLAAQDWTDGDVDAPTLLPGWSRGHLLTHLARNADGMSGTLSAALRGEVVELYPGGREQRNADIEEGATRPVADQVSDVRAACSRLDRVLGAVTEEDAWDHPAGDGVPARDWLVRRWLEIEVHHVDLDAGYTPDRWPPLFVATALPRLAETLERRAGIAVRVSIAAEGSVSNASGVDAVGRTWAAGEGEPVEVTGPDWAVLAWLSGRPTTAADSLTATPELAPWR